MGKISKKNIEGYDDPTTYEALTTITNEEQKVGKVIKIIKTFCELCGYEIEGRIVLVDMKNGRKWC